VTANPAAPSMTGTEHYAEAERLLQAAFVFPSENDETNPAATLAIAEAQVHATLAMAAALTPPIRWVTGMTS
jgi:hypothetical protein